MDTFIYAFTKNDDPEFANSSSASENDDDTDISPIVTGHEKIGLMYTQNLTTFLNFKLQ